MSKEAFNTFYKLRKEGINVMDVVGIHCYF